MDISFLHDSPLFSYLILPLLIVLARIIDVSIGTLRIIFVMGGQKSLSLALGFIESLVWLLAISQIMQNLNNVFCYIAYPTGFALGTYLGIIFDEKLALGKVVVRIITRNDHGGLLSELNKQNHRYTHVPAQGNEGPVDIVFLVIRRQDLNEVLSLVQQYNPEASYTVEGVKRVSEEATFPFTRTKVTPFFRFMSRGK